MPSLPSDIHWYSECCKYGTWRNHHDGSLYWITAGNNGRLGIASALGAAAGVLIALSFNAIEPTMGTSMGFKGLAVLIMGGLGNVGGAMAGGFILGVAEVFSVAYGASSFRDAVAFGLIILILFIRPQGLFAEAGKGGRP